MSQAKCAATKAEVEIPVSRCVICDREELADGKPIAADPRHFPTHGNVTYAPSEADSAGRWDFCDDHLRIIVDEIEAAVRRERSKL